MIAKIFGLTSVGFVSAKEAGLKPAPEGSQACKDSRALFREIVGESLCAIALLL